MVTLINPPRIITSIVSKILVSHLTGLIDVQKFSAWDLVIFVNAIFLFLKQEFIPTPVSRFLFVQSVYNRKIYYQKKNSFFKRNSKFLDKPIVQCFHQIEENVYEKMWFWGKGSNEWLALIFQAYCVSFGKIKIYS